MDTEGIAHGGDGGDILPSFDRLRASTPPSGTITFLFTDIEGSTRLLERLRDRYAELLAVQRDLLRDCFARWHGHEVDTQGDAFFVAFARAADAVRCAIDAQQALSSQSWVGGVELRVRMGIHTGEPTIGPTGYVGMAVHRAARIAAAGHGGQILLSATTADLASDDLPQGTRLRDLGSHKLKDLRGETRILQVDAGGLAVEFPALKTATADEPPPTPGDAPYRGMQAFEEEDAGLFFGRETTVEAVVNRLRAVRFLALIGASGSGKSSILRAGVIPTMRRRRPAPRIVLLTPTAHPLEALAVALAGSDPTADVARFVDDLRRDTRSLALHLRREASGRRTGGVFLAVDQLEEAFTLCRDEAERIAFLDNLAIAAGLDESAASSAPEADRARLIVTLRADFYAFLAPHAMLREAAAVSQAYIGPMSSVELRRAIEGPAAAGGWEFVPGLVDLLLRDVGAEPGALPLLSHALLETWRNRRGTTMTLKGYAEAGEVKGAIARTADMVYGSLTDDQRTIARNIFVRLTELGEGTQDTRRRAALGELLPSDPAEATASREVLRALADARLVTVAEDSVEVAHEALIREWPTLREWLRSDREGLRVHRRLTEAAREWELSDFDPAVLYRGSRLAQVSDWAAANPAVPNEIERRFLSASRKQQESEEVEREQARQRELEAAHALASAESARAAAVARAATRLRRRAVLLAGAMVVSAALAVVAVVLAGQSSENAALAEARAAEAQESFANAESQRLGAEANGILLRGENPELAALLALNGLRAAYTPQADAALQRASRAYFGEQLLQHPGRVDAVVTSPDGRLLYTASGTSAWIWDLAGGEPRELPARAGDFLFSLSLSSDGGRLLGFSPPWAVVWSVPDGEEIARIQVAESIGAWADHERLSPNGEALAAASEAGVFLIPIEGGEPTQVTEASAAAVAFSPDGDQLAVLVEDSIRVLNLDGEPMIEFGAEIGGFRGIEFSPDGRLLVTSGWDRTARLWDVDSGELLQTFEGHGEFLFRAVVSPDGSRVLTGSLDTSARLWDVETGSELHRYSGHTGAVYGLAFSPDGDSAFTASKDGTVRRWATDVPAELNTYRAGDTFVFGVAFSADSRLLATASVERLQVRDLSSGELLLDVEGERFDSVSFSPDGSLLLTGGDTGALWDLRTGSKLRDQLGPSGGFTASGDRYLAFSNEDFQWHLWETESGRDLMAFHDGWNGALSPDGSLVATGTDLDEVNVWIYDAASGAQRHAIEVGEGIVAAAFSPDGRYLATASRDNVARIYEASTGELVRELHGHTNIVWGIAYTPDGRLLTASQDKSVRLWDPVTGRQLRLFAGHANAAVAGGAASPDGRLVAIGSFDGHVQLTPTGLDDLQASVCARLLRDLTEHERVIYEIESGEPTCPEGS